MTTGGSTPGHAEVPPRQRIMAIIEGGHFYTLDLALMSLLDAEHADDYRAEADVAGVGLGEKVCASSAEISHAIDRAWKTALCEANAVLEHLRRRIWPMAAARMPEHTIIAAADQVMASHGTFIPDDLLYPMLRGIWAASTPRRSGGGRARPSR